MVVSVTWFHWNMRDFSPLAFFVHCCFCLLAFRDCAFVLFFCSGSAPLRKLWNALLTVAGHDSFEDARATLLLALLKAKNGPAFGVRNPEQQRVPVLGLLDGGQTRSMLSWHQLQQQQKKKVAAEAGGTTGTTTSSASSSDGISSTDSNDAILYASAVGVSVGNNGSGSMDDCCDDADTGIAGAAVVANSSGGSGARESVQARHVVTSCMGGNARTSYHPSGAETVDSICRVIAEHGAGVRAQMQMHGGGGGGGIQGAGVQGAVTGAEVGPEARSSISSSDGTATYKVDLVHNAHSEAAAVPLSSWVRLRNHVMSHGKDRQTLTLAAAAISASPAATAVGAPALSSNSVADSEKQQQQQQQQQQHLLDVHVPRKVYLFGNISLQSIVVEREVGGGAGAGAGIAGTLEEQVRQKAHAATATAQQVLRYVEQVQAAVRSARGCSQAAVEAGAAGLAETGNCEVGGASPDTLLLITVQDSIQPVVELLQRKRLVMRNPMASAVWGPQDEMRLKDLRRHNLAYMCAKIV
jgi:hypothetical protein